ncbi:MAG TPA: hypothetical protein VI977_01860 [archaeon]|nr:hypothetical protein [archaeon]
MNQQLDKAMLVTGAIIMMLMALLLQETQLLIALLATVAFLYMALKYDALKEKTEKPKAKEEQKPKEEKKPAEKK